MPRPRYIRLSIISLHEHFQWALEKGNIDIVIYAPPNLKLREFRRKEFTAKPCTTQTMCMSVRNTHPLAIKLREGKQLKRSDLKNYRFIAAPSTGYSQGNITERTPQVLRKGAISPLILLILLTVPHMLTQCRNLTRAPAGIICERTYRQFAAHHSSKEFGR